MIGRTWDRQFATYPPQPDGPLKGAGGYVFWRESISLSLPVMTVARYLPMLELSAPTPPIVDYCNRFVKETRILAHGGRREEGGGWENYTVF